MSDEYLQKKIDDGAVAFKWLGLALALLIVLGAYRCATAQGGASPGAQPPEFKPRDWGTGRWAFGDTVLAAAYCGLRYVDAAQSATMARNPDKWKESGPLAVMVYGEHPTVNEVYKFNAAMCAGMTFISYQIDPPTRAWWQWGIIGGEVYVINENRKLGIKPDWPLFGVKINL